MRRISAENLYKSPADPPMARATVLFQNQDRHSLCLLRPGGRKRIKHFCWLAAFLQIFRIYYDVFQKQGAIKGMCAPAFFFLKMKATIIMCALVFVFPKNEHHNLHVCALRLGFFQKLGAFLSCGSRVLWKSKYELVSMDETRGLFRWLDTQHSRVGHHAQDRT